MRKIIISLSVFALFSAGQIFFSQRADAEQADLVTVKFYKWYLHSLSENHDPLQDDKKILGTYVTSTLIGEIEKQIKSAEGLDVDYFIQTQDYLDDWEKNISAKITSASQSSELIAVTLGATPESRHELFVTLIQEGNLWKIRKVQLAKN